MACSTHTGAVKPNWAKNMVALFFAPLIYIFILISIPVYMFRVVVIYLAKAFRPDLGDIFSGQAGMFLGDYMSETPPRSNLVLILILEGKLTLHELQTLVIKNWISNNELENFHRYPEKWMGFTFWKKISKPFSVDDYVYECSSMKEQVSDDELDELTETLLNTRIPRLRSPWELHLIKNYKNPNAKTGSHSALVLKWHHCLADGAGVTRAFVEGLFQQQMMRQQESPPIKMTRAEQLLWTLSFPIRAAYQMSPGFYYRFVKSPFKIPDEKKEWHQVCARSGLIANQLIKDIKNEFGVSYAAVLLSAISAAVDKTQMQKNESVLFSSALPAIGIRKRKVLANHMTATSVSLPITGYTSPAERLKTIDQLFDVKKRCAIPLAVQCWSSLLTKHFNPVAEFLGNNKTSQIALSNFAGPCGDIVVNENTKWIHSTGVAGCLAGETGMIVCLLSHGAYTQLNVVVERALMNKKQAQVFVDTVKKEVEALGALRDKKIREGKNKHFCGC